MGESYHINDNDATKIAIVGMAGRFPGANTLDALWQNLKDGVESISFFTDAEVITPGIIDEALLQNPNYVRAGAVLEDIDQFDASFFGYAPSEAALIDPQHRLFLECAWEALEGAGYNPDTYNKPIGVFAGGSVNTYLLYNLSAARDFIGPEHFTATLLANEKDFLATRVAYKCNLKGPAMTVQTACSTSLVATHLACQSLLNGETDIALAGGVTVKAPHKTGYLYQEGGIFSHDGHCRAFDAEALGTVPGNGVGVVVLKRLSDALAAHDHIYAVILGSAVNNDGAGKFGYTAPSEEGQAAVIAEALAISTIAPETVSYIEAHGTGTPLGDPIEIAALTQIYGANGRTKGSCPIGSVKTNFGHLDVASGIAGLIKTVLALQHQAIPPSLHFKHANPNIDFASSPFYVNTQLRSWETGVTPRRAGVSAFGLGGTNVHMILEEAPLPTYTPSTNPWQLLLLSTKTPESLEQATTNLAIHLKQSTQSLDDIAYTLQVGRKSFAYRRFAVCHNHTDAIATLEAQEPERLLTHHWKSGGQKVVFLFPGQGAQYVQMARDVYHQFALFREHFDNCSFYIQQCANFDLHSVLYPVNGSDDDAKHVLDQTAKSQLALFTIEYALAQLWMSWGVTPSSMIGHSIGEYVAACLAGVFSLEDALKLVTIRGRLMQAQPGGSMLAVPLSQQNLQSWLGQDLSLAAVNGPELCVVSGPDESITHLEEQLALTKITCRRLHTSHAFHSHMMEPVMEPFLKHVKQVTLHSPRLPYLSNLTGTWITAAEATDPTYWTHHLRQTVCFSQNIEEVLRQNGDIFLEIGPGRTLSTLVKRHPAVRSEQTVISSLRHPQDRSEDTAFLLTALGKLWLAGVQPDWEEVHAPAQPARVPLPTYPFERQRYWISTYTKEHPSSSSSVIAIGETTRVASQSQYSRHHLHNEYVEARNQRELLLTHLWQPLLGIEKIGIYDNFFDLGGDSFLALQLISKIQTDFQVEMLLHHVVEAPTIVKQATLIQALLEQKQQDIKTDYSPLVPLKPEGTQQPLFLMHPAGGSVLCYLELARLLDPDQPLYGLQASSLYGGPNHETIEDVASYYLKVVQDIQPHGPYLLGGMSYGGNLAFEMARQLSQQGEVTSSLIMFDSHPPVSYHGPDVEATRFIAAFPWIIGLLLGQSRPMVTYKELQQYDPQEQLAYIFQRINEDKLFPLNMDQQQIHQFFDIWEVHHHALRQYNPPQRSYSGEIALFRAQEDQPPDLLDLLKINLSGTIPVSGWERLTTAPMRIFTVSGNHYTMLNQPNVQVLGQQLNAYLHKLRQNHSLSITVGRSTL